MTTMYYRLAGEEDIRGMPWMVCLPAWQRVLPLIFAERGFRADLGRWWPMWLNPRPAHGMEKDTVFCPVVREADGVVVADLIMEVGGG